MRFNPSLTARLRIGFVVLFALLLIVSLFGVGRLFQIRVNYEDDTSRFFQLELESEHLRSAFIVEQSAARPPAPGVKPDRAQFNQAAASFREASRRAADLTDDDTVLKAKLDQLIANEAAWRQAIAKPLLAGRLPPPPLERRLTKAVTTSSEELSVATRGARDSARDNARTDTRNTTILVAAGL